ncbi:MAG: Nif3-like dinuclear metal center hexameric protein [Anaerolineaceae bacterium]|nr:Nif3-like dinuclear metal center hexameric protein [Anaerolineaceae bacterium]
MIRVRDVLAAIDRAAPFRLQQDWDNSGLLIGDPKARVRKLLVALDHTTEVIGEARRRRADLLVTHHPLFLEGTKRLTTESPDGAAALRMAAWGMAHIAAHTNYDAAPGGLNDLLARKLGLAGAVPLDRPPSGDGMKLVVFVPPDDLERVERAVFAAGAGRIGDYSRCSFRVGGTGTFRGGPSTRPAVGRRSRRQEVRELRLETVVPPGRVAEVVRALRNAHPYEEPAFDLYPLAALDERAGLGRVGTPAKGQTLRAFIERVQRSLKARTVEVIGSPGRHIRIRIERVAVVGGGGGSLWPQALAAGAQVLVTGEMKHHHRLASREAGLVTILAGHWATEHVAVGGLARLLRATLPEIKVLASTAERNPTTWR